VINSYTVNATTQQNLSKHATGLPTQQHVAVQQAHMPRVHVMA